MRTMTVGVRPSGWTRRGTYLARVAVVGIAAISSGSCGEFPTYPSITAFESVEPPALANLKGGDKVTIKVVVKGAGGRGIAGVPVSFTATGTDGGAKAEPSSTSTDGNGIAQTSWTIATKAGVKNTLTARAYERSVPFDGPVTRAGNPSKIVAASSVTLTGTAGDGVTVLPKVKVVDAFDNGVPGVGVTFALTGAAGSLNGAAKTSDNNGEASPDGWTLGNSTLVSYEVRAKAAGVNDSVVFRATASAAAPDSIRILDGDLQTAVAGTTVQNIKTLVIDRFKNPVPSANVYIRKTNPKGIITDSTVMPAGPDGVVTYNWILAREAGRNVLTTEIRGARTVSVSFSANGTPGPADSLVARSETSQSAVVGSLAKRPSVVAKDQWGNPIALKDSTRITFQVKDALRSRFECQRPDSITVTTGTDGVATACDWRLSNVRGDNVVWAAGKNLQGADLKGSPVRFTAVGRPLPKDLKVVLSTDGQRDTVGKVVARDPQVTVTDAGGDGVEGIDVVFIVASGKGRINGRADSTIATTDASGVATAKSWTLGDSALTNTLTAKVLGSNDPALRATFTATGLPAAPARLVSESTLNEMVAAGAQLQRQVRVTDRFGNTVTTPTVDVTFTVSGGGTVNGQPGPVVVQAQGGQASVTWNVGASTGDKSLVASSPGLTSVTFTARATVLPFTVNRLIDKRSCEVSLACTFKPVEATGGVAPYTFSQSGLPAGLSINSSTGEISGTPSASTPSATVTITVTDAATPTPASDQKTMTLRVADALYLSPDKSVACTVNRACPDAAMQGTAGVPKRQVGTRRVYSYELRDKGDTSKAGVLPQGLAFDADSATITGTPKTVTSGLQYMLLVTDSLGARRSGELTVVVNDTVHATASTAIKGCSDQAQCGYQPVTATGGTKALNYTYTLRNAANTANASLPAGLNFSTTSGAISGTATSSSAPVTYTVLVTDARNDSSSATFSLSVLTTTAVGTAPHCTINIPNGANTVQCTRSSYMTVNPGAAVPNTNAYQIVTGSLPTGVTFDQNTGDFTVNDQATASTHIFTVKVTDGRGAFSQRQVTITLQ